MASVEPVTIVVTRRIKLGARSVDLIEADAAWRTQTGLEFWFTAPNGTVVPQPSLLRMTSLMIGVVYILMLSIGQVVKLVLADAPQPLKLLVTIASEVALLTWVIMRRHTRWVAKWIYPTSGTTLRSSARHPAVATDFTLRHGDRDEDRHDRRRQSRQHAWSSLRRGGT